MEGDKRGRVTICHSERKRRISVGRRFFVEFLHFVQDKPQNDRRINEIAELVPSVSEESLSEFASATPRNDISLKGEGYPINNLKVNCYSGHTYAERPVSFQWQGIDYEVEEIEKSWQGPGERHFLVKTRDNKSFQLCYNEAKDQWSLTLASKE